MIISYDHADSRIDYNSVLERTLDGCFKENLIRNEPISHHTALKKTEGQKGDFQAKKASLKCQCQQRKKQKPCLTPKSPMTVRRSYGSLPFNYQSKVQLNDQADLRNFAITPDILANQQRLVSEQLKEDQRREEALSERLRKEAAKVSKYKRRKLQEEVYDAYYAAEQETQEAKNREKGKEDTIKRVNSLVRVNSAQHKFDFPQSTKQKAESVEKVISLKHQLRGFRVPKLMGVPKVHLATKDPEAEKRQANKKAALRAKSEADLFQSQKKESKQNLRSEMNRRSTVKDCEKIHQKKTMGLNTEYYENFDITPSKETHTKQSPMVLRGKSVSLNFLPTATSLKSRLQNDLTISEACSSSVASFGNEVTDCTTKQENKKVISFQSVKPYVRHLDKCKSSKEFLEQQRVKSTRDAFSSNWKQHPNKERQPFLFQGKHSQALKNELNHLKAQENLKLRHQKYGPSIDKPNPLQIEDYSNEHQTYENYSNQFKKVSKNVRVLVSKY